VWQAQQKVRRQRREPKDLKSAGSELAG
jgi:hypothetical protein